MKKILGSIILAVALSTTVSPAPEAQALGVTLSSRSDNHHPLIRLVGWFGELPVWKFLPQGHLYTTKDIEAIFGPNYSESKYVYQYRCKDAIYTLSPADNAKIFESGRSTYYDIVTNADYAKVLYADNPDWDCTLGRSQNILDRAQAVLQVASSSVINFK